MFAIRRLGEPEDVLGIEVLRDWDASRPKVSLERHRSSVSVRTRMESPHQTSYVHTYNTFKINNAFNTYASFFILVKIRSACKMA